MTFEMHELLKGYEGNFSELIGKIPVALYISEDKETLRVITTIDGQNNYHIDPGNAEMFQYKCFGDCCSNSWIEHINGIKAILGKKIVNVVEREMPEQSWDIPERECIAFYGWSLETEAGRCDIEMRNESNGYYGGWLELDYGQDQYSSLEDKIQTSLTLIKKDF